MSKVNRFGMVALEQCNRVLVAVVIQETPNDLDSFQIKNFWSLPRENASPITLIGFDVTEFDDACLDELLEGLKSGEIRVENVANSGALMRKPRRVRAVFECVSKHVARNEDGWLVGRQINKSFLPIQNL